jgi:CRISPR/Cas system-associated exonuclease Cas4 (RecB family)
MYLLQHLFVGTRLKWKTLKSNKMKKALRKYLLNLSKQLRLITDQQFIKEKTTKNEKQCQHC